MFKIGFIDYYLDEFHANCYPAWIKEASGGAMEVAFAYGMKDKAGGMTNAEWSRTYGVRLLDTIEDVVRMSDGLIVLSPDNPEMHETLAELPLRSGKPTYIDKTFAPNRAAAERLFALAERYGTPMYSASALRYAAEYEELANGEPSVVSSWGPGEFETYAIHQLEPIVALLGSRPQRLMAIGTAASPSLVIEFAGGKQATIRHFGRECPFTMAVMQASGTVKIAKVESDFFAAFIRRLVRFFETGEPAVDPQETIAIITIIEYGRKALREPFTWIELPG
jgi:hypothetical protein